MVQRIDTIIIFMVIISLEIAMRVNIISRVMVVVTVVVVAWLWYC